MLLGLRIKQLRESKKISVSDFAEKIGVVRQTVYDYESNKTEPSLDTLRKICTTLEVTLVDIFRNRTDLEFELNPLGGQPGLGFRSDNRWHHVNDYSLNKLYLEIEKIRAVTERQNEVINRLIGLLENNQLGKLFDVTLGGLAIRESYQEAKVVSMESQEVANSVTSLAERA